MVGKHWILIEMSERVEDFGVQRFKRAFIWTIGHLLEPSENFAEMTNNLNALLFS